MNREPSNLLASSTFSSSPASSAPPGAVEENSSMSQIPGNAENPEEIQENSVATGASGRKSSKVSRKRNSSSSDFLGAVHSSLPQDYRNLSDQIIVQRVLFFTSVLGVSKTFVAFSAGTSPSTLSLFLNGRHQKYPFNIDKLRRALQIFLYRMDFLIVERVRQVVPDLAFPAELAAFGWSAEAWARWLDFSMGFEEPKRNSCENELYQWLGAALSKDEEKSPARLIRRLAIEELFKARYSAEQLGNAPATNTKRRDQAVEALAPMLEILPAIYRDLSVPSVVARLLFLQEILDAPQTALSRLVGGNQSILNLLILHHGESALYRFNEELATARCRIFFYKLDFFIVELLRGALGEKTKEAPPALIEGGWSADLWSSWLSFNFPFDDSRRAELERRLFAWLAKILRRRQEFGSGKTLNALLNLDNLSESPEWEEIHKKIFGSIIENASVEEGEGAEEIVRISISSSGRPIRRKAQKAVGALAYHSSDTEETSEGPAKKRPKLKGSAKINAAKGRKSGPVKVADDEDYKQEDSEDSSATAASGLLTQGPADGETAASLWAVGFHDRDETKARRRRKPRGGRLAGCYPDNLLGPTVRASAQLEIPEVSSDAVGRSRPSGGPCETFDGRRWAVDPMAIRNALLGQEEASGIVQSGFELTQLHGSSIGENPILLPAFQSSLDPAGSSNSPPSDFFLNIGGPLRALAWAPVGNSETPAHRCDHFLAIAADSQLISHSRFHTSSASREAIQIWRIPLIRSEHANDQPSFGPPELVYLFVHDFGTCLSLVWFPDGCWNFNRLGVLAASFGARTVKIFAVPQPLKDFHQTAIFPLARLPGVSLAVHDYHNFALPSPCFAQASSLAWHFDSFHPRLAIGTSNGFLELYQFHSSEDSPFSFISATALSKRLAPILSLCFHPFLAHQIACGTADGQISLVDARRCDEEAIIFSYFASFDPVPTILWPRSCPDLLIFTVREALRAVPFMAAAGVGGKVNSFSGDLCFSSALSYTANGPAILHCSMIDDEKLGALVMSAAFSNGAAFLSASDILRFVDSAAPLIQIKGLSALNSAGAYEAPLPHIIAGSRPALAETRKMRIQWESQFKLAGEEEIPQTIITRAVLNENLLYPRQIATGGGNGIIRIQHVWNI